MARPSTLNRILVVLCLLAIPCAQLFGVGKVFLCDCSGIPVAMLEDRCFGASGEDCHPGGHDHDHGAPDGDEDSEKHPSGQAEFRTGPFCLNPVALPAPVIADALRLEIPCLRTSIPIEARRGAEPFSDPPPDPLPARHFVLLI